MGKIYAFGKKLENTEIQTFIGRALTQFDDLRFETIANTRSKTFFEIDKKHLLSKKASRAWQSTVCHGVSFSLP